MQADIDPFELFDLPRRHAVARDLVEVADLGLSKAALPDNVVA